MKTLDRYIVRNFLFMTMLCFLVLMSLRIVVDLFVNMDEFAKQSRETQDVVRDVLTYYGYQSVAFVTELGGVIIVSAAAFTLAMMNHTNELTAILSSGVSLRRVVLPIVICSMLLGGLVILDQEMLIPQLADRLVRDRDDVGGAGSFPVRLVPDELRTVWLSRALRPSAETMDEPIAIFRDADNTVVAAAIGTTGQSARPGEVDGACGWLFTGAVLPRTRQTAWPSVPTTERVHSSISPQALLTRGSEQYRQATGRDLLAEPDPPPAGAFEVRDEHYGLTVRAERFVPDPPGGEGQERTGVLTGPRFVFHSEDGTALATILGDSARWSRPRPGESWCWKLENGRLFCPSSLTVGDLQLRQSSRWLDFMSSRQLGDLLRLRRVPDRGAALLAKHVRITEPINNLVMLMLALPFVLSRERNIKASAGLCLLMVATFYVFVYICRYMGLPPPLAAWMPATLFGPIAVVMFDSVKT